MQTELNVISAWDHCAQVITGFLDLARDTGMELKIRDLRTEGDRNTMAVVEVLYRGLRLVYDVEDGYQNLDGLRSRLDDCDLYFKRSFSAEYNDQYLTEDQKKKLHPLGMNYFLMCPGNPYLTPPGGEGRLGKLHRIASQITTGARPNSYFTSDKFTEIPQKKDGPFRILFCTRLWNCSAGDEEEQAWTRQLNDSRIATLRTLRQEFGDAFTGGLYDSPLSREAAPDLIMAPRTTSKVNYLKRLHQSDICVGTLGLFHSTGWKTGEYVAAAKAIVHEELCYTAPGDFSAPRNYLSFRTEQELLQQVERLAGNAELVYAMKCANREYYEQYLKPASMIRNTLALADSCLG